MPTWLRPGRIPNWRDADLRPGGIPTWEILTALRPEAGKPRPRGRSFLWLETELRPPSALGRENPDLEVGIFVGWKSSSDRPPP